MRERRAIGYEALTRGPAGSEIESPQALFAAAREEGMLEALDTACQTQAIRIGLDAGMARPLTLFLNGELERASSTPPRTDASAYADALGRELPIVFEVTERGLLDDPAAMILSVDRARSVGWGVALDDLGADPRALALLPVVDPDVIKLDMALIQGAIDPQLAEVAHAVAAELELKASPVIAEGIETGPHVERAEALGATYAQGFLYGRPEPMKALTAETAGGPALAEVSAEAHIRADPTATTYELLAEATETRIGDKPMLFALVRRLEEQSRGLGPSGLMISSFQSAANFTPGTAERYESFAEKLGFVGAIGTGMPPEPARGVRGGEFPLDSARRHVWSTAVISPHFAGVICGRELDSEGQEGERRFRFGLSHDRRTVAACARSLLGLIEPLRSRT